MKRLSVVLLTALTLGAGNTWAGLWEDIAAAAARKDDATELKLLKPLAAKGDAKAEYILGVRYVKGQGVAQNSAEGARLFRLAADQGYILAQYNLGVMYAQGQGVTQDYAEAMRLFRLAAEQGHTPAQYNLGVMYALG